MDAVQRHPRLLALLLGGLAATGFAPLGWWPVALLCVAGLMWLTENHSTSVRVEPFDCLPRQALRTGQGRDTLARASAPLDFARGERQGMKESFLLGWSFGVGHFTVGNNWIAHAFVYQDAMPHWLGYISVVLLSLYLAIWPGLATLGLHLARTRWPHVAATPLLAALWIVTEYGRATVFTGFAWDPLGMVWLGTGVDQAARVIGTYGLSGLAIIAAGALLSLARRRWHFAGPVLASFLILGILGHIRIGENVAAPTIPITVVQPNIGQVEKYDPALEQANFLKLERLTGTSSSTRPRLIFWPEAAIEAWLDMEPEWLRRVALVPGPNDLLMTGGAKVYFKDGRLVGANNSAWVVTPDARLIRRYDKAHLVPYGEYLPMRSILEPLGLSRLVPGDADFWPGPGPRSLLLPAAKDRPDRKSTRLNSSHNPASRMPSSA
jgi:apolipoprotein N-acyltransferase